MSVLCLPAVEATDSRLDGPVRNNSSANISFAYSADTTPFPLPARVARNAYFFARVSGGFGWGGEEGGVSDACDANFCNGKHEKRKTLLSSNMVNVHCL